MNSTDNNRSTLAVEESIYGSCAPYLPLVMEELREKILEMNNTVKEQTGHSLYNHLSARIKDEDSMREKCVRKQLPMTPESALNRIHDSIGIRIVTRFIEDIYKIAEYLRGLDNVTVVQEKDYVKNAKSNGYRSYHMILLVKTPFEDITGAVPGSYYAEVQLRTIAMDTWASLEHEMKYKKQLAGQELISDELKRCADELASCDLSMQTIRGLIRSSK